VAERLGECLACGFEGDSHVDVGWGKLDGVDRPALLLAGDDGCAGAREKLVDRLPRRTSP